MKKSLLQLPTETQNQTAPINPFDVESNKINQQLTSTEKYNYYLQNGIPESEIDTSTDAILLNAYKLVPETLLKNRFLLKYKNTIEGEFREHHKYSVRKSILNYILLDVEEQKRLGITLVEEKEIVYGRGPVPWHDSCEEARVLVKKHLWHLNPMMTKIKNIFEAFKENATFDFGFIGSFGHVGLEEFVGIVKDQIVKIKETLSTV